MNIVFSLKSSSQDTTANLKAEYGSKVIFPERSICDVRKKLLQTVDGIPQERYFMGEYFYKMLVQNVSDSERGKKPGIKENEYLFSFY